MDNKILGPFKVMEKRGSLCKLDLPNTIKVHPVKICGNPDESKWNSLDPFGCLLAKVAGAEALAR